MATPCLQCKSLKPSLHLELSLLKPSAQQRCNVLRGLATLPVICLLFAQLSTIGDELVLPPNRPENALFGREPSIVLERLSDLIHLSHPSIRLGRHDRHHLIQIPPQQR